MSSVPAHVLRTAVVLDDVRLLYVPIPKAGCTSLLWAVAEVAGLSERDFAHSRKLEATRALAVHDLSIWGPAFTLGERPSEEVDWIIRSPDWLRFTVVRDPVRRLWSTWVSKVLVRDPRFVQVFGDEDWFPAAPASSGDVVESFRRFVRELPARDREWHDPHWFPQVELLGWTEVAYGHVGRLERLEQSAAVVREHLRGTGRGFPSPRLSNRSVLPYAPGVFDRAALDACETWTARDREVFGYELPAGTRELDDAWHATVEATIPAIHAVIERHERILDLRSLVREADQAIAR